MNLQELESLLQELMQGISTVVQSGEVLSDEFQGQLAQTLAQLYERIEQLRGEDVPNISQTPDMEQAMPSSNVEGFAYDKDTGRMYVRFLGKYPDRNGPVYQYEGVPPYIFDIFSKGAVPAKTDGKNKWGRWWKGKYPSMGAAMYHLIRASNFPYQRVS